MTIRINDAHAIPLIARRTGIDLGSKLYCIAHYDRNDKLDGGVIIGSDNGWSAEIHSTGFIPNWGNRELIWTVFNYAFKVRKLKKLFGRVPENNHKARKLNLHLGFMEETIVDDVFFGGEGLVIMSMYENECRFINLKPPKVEFAPIEKIKIVEANEYQLLTASS
jgi:hypothetical protein